MKKDTYTINDAFAEAVNADPEELPLTDPFPSSVKFLKRMANIFKKDSSPVIALSGAFARRVAVAIVCLFTVSALSVGAGAAIIHFGGFKTNIHDKGTDLYISEEQQATIKDSIEEYYTLGAIPDDFEIVESEQLSPRRFYKEWINKDGTHILFHQIAGKTQQWNLNTENQPYEEIIFNDNEAIYYGERENYSLMWIEDGYVFNIMMQNSSIEELISLAESLQLDQFTKSSK